MSYIPIFARLTKGTMKNIKIALALTILFGVSTQVLAQGLHFGIRAGINYAEYLGPKETNEKYTLNNGFHFGLNVEYAFDDIVSLKGEFMYIQNGTKQKYEGPSYYFFNIDRASHPEVDPGQRVLIEDDLSLDLNVSNAYVGIPITAHFRTLDKWDIYGGAYVNFMVSSIGQGILEFGGTDTLTINHQFQQGLDHNYRSDIGGPSDFPAYTNNRPILLISDDFDTFTQSIAGSYYQFPEKTANAFRGIDYGVVAGVNYFLNPGLYLGLRAELGLRDITDNRMDRSLGAINADESLIFRDDYDRHFGLNLSLGFRF